MNKAARFLIVFIIVIVMFALTWKMDSQSQLSALAGDSFVAVASAVATPSLVVEVAETMEKTASMHNLVLVEFFAGY